MINFHELKRWRDHIVTIPTHLIEMSWWRPNIAECYTPECNSSGCIIGHCASLYSIDELPVSLVDGTILFQHISEKFLGFESNDPLWEFLFDGGWSIEQERGSKATQKEFALLRMDYVLKHGEQPEGWYYSMSYDELKKWL